MQVVKKKLKRTFVKKTENWLGLVFCCGIQYRLFTNYGKIWAQTRPCNEVFYTKTSTRENILGGSTDITASIYGLQVLRDFKLKY